MSSAIITLPGRGIRTRWVHGRVSDFVLVLVRGEYYLPGGWGRRAPGGG